jgi:hypothetical protein
MRNVTDVRERPSEFRLSRVQSEGWNAAWKYLASGDPGNTKKIAALNPYKNAAERERWHLGFGNAVQKSR